MASSYNNDDTYNVIEDHIIQALQADTKFASGGALEIKTWEEELRDDVATFAEGQLPAFNVEVVGQTAPEGVTVGDGVTYTYDVLATITTTGGELAQVKKTTKYYAARAVRVLQQQHLPAKQLVSLPDDVDGGAAGEVAVVVSDVEITAGQAVRNTNLLRGLVEMTLLVSVGYIIPED